MSISIAERVNSAPQLASIPPTLDQALTLAPSGAPTTCHPTVAMVVAIVLVEVLTWIASCGDVVLQL